MAELQMAVPESALPGLETEMFDAFASFNQRSAPLLTGAAARGMMTLLQQTPRSNRALSRDI